MDVNIHIHFKHCIRLCQPKRLSLTHGEIFHCNHYLDLEAEHKLSGNQLKVGLVVSPTFVKTDQVYADNKTVELCVNRYTLRFHGYFDIFIRIAMLNDSFRHSYTVNVES